MSEQVQPTVPQWQKMDGGAGECAEGDMRSTEPSKTAGKRGHEMSPKVPSQTGSGNKVTEKHSP